MTKNECNTIRQELDEADQNQQLSSRAAEHVRGCSDCRAFASDRQVLRGLLATLAPVVAPSDFDFRLRARLAREKSSAQNGGGIANFLRIPMPIAAAALVLSVAVVGVVVKNQITSSPSNIVKTPAVREAMPVASGSGTAIATPGNPEVKPAGTVASSSGTRFTPPTKNLPDAVALKNRVPRNSNFIAGRKESATRDFSLRPASVVGSDQEGNAGSVVRVPLDARALQIAIDDGRGESRTISLPRVSFGSQRLVASQPFMPSISPAKGVW